MWQAVLVEGFGTRHPRLPYLHICGPWFAHAKCFQLLTVDNCLHTFTYGMRRFLGSLPPMLSARPSVRDCVQQMRSGGQATAMAAAQMHQEEGTLFREAQTDVMMPRRRWTVKMVTRSC